MTPPDDMKRPNELHILQARLLQLQRDREELHRLLNSRSWKLTAPLRRFTEWGRKLRANAPSKKTIPYASPGRDC